MMRAPNERFVRIAWTETLVPFVKLRAGFRDAAFGGSLRDEGFYRNRIH